MKDLINFTKYEKARILGARALQISMNAPILVILDEEELEKINFDALEIAKIELDSGILPIVIKKPFPKKKEELKMTKIEKMDKDEKKEEIDDNKKISLEKKEEEDVVEGGEIMELVNPEDESSERGNEDFEED
jgi:DNA-directed RNA polymerase subunit K